MGSIAVEGTEKRLSSWGVARSTTHRVGAKPGITRTSACHGPSSPGTDAECARPWRLRTAPSASKTETDRDRWPRPSLLTRPAAMTELPVPLSSHEAEMSFRSAPMTRTDRAFGEAASAPTAKASTRSARASSVAAASNSRRTAAAYVTLFKATGHGAGQTGGSAPRRRHLRTAWSSTCGTGRTGRTTLPRTTGQPVNPTEPTSMNRRARCIVVGATVATRPHSAPRRQLDTAAPAGSPCPMRAPYPSQRAHRSIF